MNCDSPFYVLPKAAVHKVPVPCGRCPPCKLRRINGWVFRMLQELKRSSTAYFITLTYDTRYVPISPNGFMTLRKKDVQDYMKRLRKLCPQSKLKYYFVGEYGGKTGRPHYHAVIFNVPSQQYIFDAWALNGINFGSAHIGQVTTDSIAYCMKYIDKLTEKKKHGRDDRVSEFSLMSKGLGSNYLSQETKDYHTADLTRMYITKEGGHKIAMPRYYKTKIFTEEQQKQQMRIVQTMEDLNEVKQIELFRSIYPYGTEEDYYNWVESQKYGRYNKHYSQQKQRLDL